MKKILIFLISICILINIPTTVYSKQEEIKVKSSILICENTGDIILEDNAYERVSPASVTKIMSILLIAEALDSGKITLKDTVVASENAVSKGGSQIWLEVGEKMTVDELFKAVIVSSANDACTLLGEYVAGSDAAFVKMMNDRAKELGLKNTNFENCTGLDDDTNNHFSCAYDLAVIAREVMKYDIVKKYSTIWLDYLRNGKTELNNTNKLINKYKGITGLKTGTTSKAGFCLCATAQRNGLKLISVVLGGKTSDDRFDKSVELLDYGFANYKLEKLSIDKNKIGKVKIKNGVVKQLTPSYKCDQYILVNNSASDIEYKYNIKKEIKAPVSKGDIVGEIIITNNSKDIKKINLFSAENIKKIDLKYLFLYHVKNV